MELYFNARGVPIMIVDGVVADPMGTQEERDSFFLNLVLNPETINEIKSNIVSYLNSLTPVNDDSSFNVLRNQMDKITQLNGILNVVNMLDKATDHIDMLSVEQPYESWVWNSIEKEWVAPVAYPVNAPEGTYIWDEQWIKWAPAEPRPHPSWNWNDQTFQYDPPVPYPIDANPDEFIWNEQLHSWVLNG